MFCILCHLSHGSSGAITANCVLFGLSVCARCAERLSVDLVNDASVRDVLAAARAGLW